MTEFKAIRCPGCQSKPMHVSDNRRARLLPFTLTCTECGMWWDATAGSVVKVRTRKKGKSHVYQPDRR